MITTLSALREKMLSTEDAAAQSQPRINQHARQQGAVDPVNLSQATGSQAVRSGSDDALSVEFSVSRDVFTAVDDFFNLGKSGRFDAFHALPPEDKEQFVQIVAELAKSGYVGYEELIVNKKVERHEVASQIGNRRVRNARVYDNSKE
ncbi:MAG: hypothetical protein A2X79_03855 [Desulfuromonadaceae bacterium GWB2_53_15]|nr:MAG: hypothetical protein A2X83_04565 [Desulfuromonadales bacterium GWD2_54_10]OHB30824.1 MAG: hypothetical protein A2X79_03855 [Desulfuromonadaceae bacterium GWB2_53_15]